MSDRSIVWVTATILALRGVTHADDTSRDPESATLTTKVPLPARSYVRLEPEYTMVASGGNTSELLARGLLVYHGWLLPGLGPEDAASALRIDLPLQRSDTPTGRATGLGKVELLQLSGTSFGWGSIGSGLAMVLPTATSSVLGSDDVQLGPAFYGDLRSIPHLPLSLVMRSLFALGSASSRSAAFETKLQPNVSVELRDDISLSSNGEIEIDWLAHTATVPVNLRVGYSFSRHWYVEAGPEVVVSGSSRGDVTFDLEVDYLE
jgi:hypothetical protein